VLLILLSSSSLVGRMLLLQLLLPPLQFYALGSFSCQERCKIVENIKRRNGDI